MKPLSFRRLVLTAGLGLAVHWTWVAVAAADSHQEISELRAAIARHDTAYHQRAEPEITDYDYDRLKQRLAALERQTPDAGASQGKNEIGDDRSGLFKTQRHRERMLSLDNTYAESDLRAFHAR